MSPRTVNPRDIAWNAEEEAKSLRGESLFIPVVFVAYTPPTHTVRCKPSALFSLMHHYDASARTRGHQRKHGSGRTRRRCCCWRRWRCTRTTGTRCASMSAVARRRSASCSFFVCLLKIPSWRMMLVDLVRSLLHCLVALHLSNV